PFRVGLGDPAALQRRRFNWDFHFQKNSWARLLTYHPLDGQGLLFPYRLLAITICLLSMPAAWARVDDFLDLFLPGVFFFESVHPLSEILILDFQFVGRPGDGEARITSTFITARC